jgi:hypothetical protein
MRKSFILHLDSLCILDKLSTEQKGNLFDAIYRYQLTGEVSPIDNLTEIVFTPFLNQFKRDAEKYQTVIEKRREAGAKGGKQKLANASKSKQSIANLADSVSDSKNDSVSDSKNKIFTPPQLFEVIEYFAENGYSEQAATKAFNYYNVAEWKDSNGKKVKNWKQKMQMVWFKDEHKDKPKAKDDGTDPNYISPTGLKGTFEIEQRGNITIRNYHGLHQYEYSSDGGRTWNKRDKP